MSRSWQPYARHILDTIAKIRRITARGDLAHDEILYDAALRNLQTLADLSATAHGSRRELNIFMSRISANFSATAW